MSLHIFSRELYILQNQKCALSVVSIDDVSYFPSSYQNKLSYESDFDDVNTLYLNKTTLMLHTIFNAHQPILIIFGRDVAETACYRMVVCYLTSPD